MRATVLALCAAIGMTGSAFADNAPIERVTQDILHGRAIEAAVWGMAAVNTDLMLQAALKAGAKENEVIYWSRPVDWHNQSLTPNPDAIYFMVFFNTSNGPVVIQIPPADGGHSITGNIDDIWQMPLEDTGPSGADKGKGGKYLILPPGYVGKIPHGFIPLHGLTHTGYALIRSNLASHADADVAGSVEYGKRIAVYDLKSSAHPPATKFTDAVDTLFDSTIPYDERFFESLDRVVQKEPWLDRDRVMIDLLRSIGIEKGKPFNPDAVAKAALAPAIQDAHVWLDHRYETIFPSYWPMSRWAVPALNEHIVGLSSGYADPNSYPVDARATTYTLGYVGIKRLGQGQFYLLTSMDKDGKSFDGSATYRLHVPPNAPVELYWSATAYDRETHALIKTMTRASRASNDAALQKNPDGSTDVYFGPAAPAGKESNWVPTDPARRFELMFRLYAPTKALFEKTWALPDAEKVSSQ